MNSKLVTDHDICFLIEQIIAIILNWKMTNQNKINSIMDLVITFKDTHYKAFQKEKVDKNS